MKSFGRVAVEEHLYKKLPLTRLEAIVLYGVNDLTGCISKLRASGMQIERRVITMEDSFKRLQKITKCKPLSQTPIKDIRTSEYRLIK
jgi:hypothetical protein